VWQLFPRHLHRHHHCVRHRHARRRSHHLIPCGQGGGSPRGHGGRSARSGRRRCKGVECSAERGSGRSAERVAAHEGGETTRTSGGIEVRGGGYISSNILVLILNFDVERISDSGRRRDVLTAGRFAREDGI